MKRNWIDWLLGQKPKPCVPVSCPEVTEIVLDIQYDIDTTCAVCDQSAASALCLKLTHANYPGRTFYMHPSCAKDDEGRATMARKFPGFMVGPRPAWLQRPHPHPAPGTGPGVREG